MNISLKNVRVMEYKSIKDIKIDVSKKLNCFIGDNATGKTSLLEGISGEKAIYYSGDFARNIELTLVVDVSEIEALSTLHIYQIEVKMKQSSDNWSYEFVEAKGLDCFVEKMSKEILKSKEVYDEHIKGIYTFLLEMKKQIDRTPSNIPKEFDRTIFSYPIDKLNITIMEYEAYMDSEKNFVEQIFPGLLFETEVMNYRLNWDLFDLKFLDEHDYKHFKETVSRYTISDYGEIYNVSEMDKYYYKLRKQFDEIQEVLDKHKKRYDKKEQVIKTGEDSFYDVLNEIRDVKSSITKKCSDFLRDTTHISSSFYERHINNNEKIESSHIAYLNLFGIDPSTRDISKLSEGEKWIYQLTKRISQMKGKLLFIDEPGMYLNPLLQKRVLEFFEILVSKGVQVFYSTHVEMLISMDNSSNVYITYLDENHNVQIENADFSELEKKSELIIGDLLMKFVRNIIIVEGENDKKLLDYFFKQHKDIDEGKYHIYDCKGNGVRQAIEFCISMTIDFKAFLDLDKKRKLKPALKEKYNIYEPYIVYAGTDEREEIEGWMTEQDFNNFCAPDKDDNTKIKMNGDDLDKFINSEGELSDMLYNKICESLIKIDILK